MGKGNMIGLLFLGFGNVIFWDQRIIFWNFEGMIRDFLIELMFQYS